MPNCWTFRVKQACWIWPIRSTQNSVQNSATKTWSHPLQSSFWCHQTTSSRLVNFVSTSNSEHQRQRRHRSDKLRAAGTVEIGFLFQNKVVWKWRWVEDSFWKNVGEHADFQRLPHACKIFSCFQLRCFKAGGLHCLLSFIFQLRTERREGVFGILCSLLAADDGRLLEKIRDLPEEPSAVDLGLPAAANNQLIATKSRYVSWKKQCVNCGWYR